VSEQTVAGASARHRTLSGAAVVAAAMIFGLTYSLSATLIALDLAERGLGDTAIGLNAAMQAVGVLATAPFLPWLVARFGVHVLMLAAIVVSAPTLAAFPFMPSTTYWFPLRLLLGGASEILFVLAQTWVSGLSSESNRGRNMAGYTAFLSLGLALGPTILAIIGTLDATPYLVGAGLILIAALFLLIPGLLVPPFEHPPSSGLWRVFRLAPIAILTTLLNASLETAGLSFLPIYAIGAGWGEEQATLLVSTLMFGAILMQLPIGWLSDKVDRRRLAIALGFLSGLAALAWPAILHLPWIAYPLMFVWGGLFVGIYTIMLTVVGSRFKGGELVGIYAVMGLTWGIGALIGPALAGIAMSAFTHGLPLFAAAACILFALFMTLTRART
jgi:MFS family permease